MLPQSLMVQVHATSCSEDYVAPGPACDCVWPGLGSMQCAHAAGGVPAWVTQLRPWFLLCGDRLLRHPTYARMSEKFHIPNLAAGVTTPAIVRHHLLIA